METLIFSRHSASDIRKIEAIVRSADCFVALINGDLYEIGNHLASESFKFTATLDRNVYTRITALVSGRPIPAAQLPDHRCAAAILAFAKIADITFDYASSLYEYASIKGGEEALNELRLFRCADNAHTDAVLDFALGRLDYIPCDALQPSPCNGSTPLPNEFERTTRKYRINYTFALKIAELSTLPLPGVEKMLRFIDWMEDEFFLGSPATLFANRFFSPTRFGRMLKGTSQKAIRNAAWDMTLVQEWRSRAFKARASGASPILVTRDKAVKSIARMDFVESAEELASNVQSPWGKNTQEGTQICRRYLEMQSRFELGDRGGRKLPSYESQLHLMRALEERLFGADCPPFVRRKE